MLPDHDTCFRALAARDTRFDGLFFVAVSTTGIYCRPICPARIPGRSRCRFFSCAAAAEYHGFRPCLRCRPELAPGFAPVDAGRRTAHAAAERIKSGALNHGGTVDLLADEFAVSARQLRRVVMTEFGVTPVQLAQTTRLLLAKQLLTETDLAMIDVAHASGFESVRRFNVLFKSRYGLTPSSMRRTAATADDHGCIRLSMGYRPPYAWEAMLEFLQPRLTSGVEAIIDGGYVRSVHIDDCHGWFEVRHRPQKSVLTLRVSVDLLPVLGPLLSRIRNLFDVDARPDVIAAHLQQDALLAPLVESCPGIRLPGTMDSLELAVRTILGQQISVKAATTLAGRLADKLGDPMTTPWPQLNRLTPTARRLSRTRLKTFTDLGILESRAKSIQSLAREVANDRCQIPDGDYSDTVEQLTACPGIGDWTAEYIAMRALPWPDAFPAGDLGLRKAAGGLTRQQLKQRAAGWRPWRAYAAMYLWHSLSTTAEKSN